MADEQRELFEQAIAPEPAPVETPPPEPAPAEPAPAPAPAETPPEPGVPSWRLREESEARRAAETRARQLEERLTQLETARRQAEKQPDFFEDPNKATQEIIARHLTPFVEETRQREQYMGKMIAGVVHGQDKVDAAEKAFLEAMNGRSLDLADYERVVTSPNRYDAVVQWHKRQSVLTSVGDDPNAWFEKQLEARLADPNFQAQMLEKVRTGAAGRPSATELPPSLSKVTASRGNSTPPGDMSDRSLWANATK